MNGKHYDMIVEDDFVNMDTSNACGRITTTNDSFAWNVTPYYDYSAWKSLYGSVTKIKSKGGDDDMRYLFEVILVNPKTDTFSEIRIVAKSETSALMKAYDATQFKNKINKTLVGNLEGVDFDDLKTSCRVLMEWKKEKSLKKAIETIKEIVD